MPAAFSFFDPEYRHNPYPVLARLRQQDPVHDTGQAWIVTRHADVTQLLRDPRCGRSLEKLGPNSFTGRFPDRKGLAELSTKMMLHVDGADHVRMRKLMAYAFTPKAIEQMAERIEHVAMDLLERMPHAGTLDLMRDFARPLPIQVICDVMQVPREDFAKLEHWSDAIVQHLELTSTPEQIGAADLAYLEFKDYLAAFVDSRRHEPGNGLIDRLIEAERETEALSSSELLANIILLLIAGHETTTNLIGNGMLSLLQTPGQLELLRSRPELLPTAVEEALRYESPANTNLRVPDVDIEIGGKVIPKGARIICMFGAANRDPAVFEEPDAFDVTRDPNPHVSFGGGAHFCIGAHLSRLEARIAFRRLFERYRTIELCADRVHWRDRINLRGLGQLGVKLAR